MVFIRRRYGLLMIGWYDLGCPHSGQRRMANGELAGACETSGDFLRANFSKSLDKISEMHIITIRQYKHTDLVPGQIIDN